MFLETALICITVYALFGDYMKEKVRALEIENDRKEESHDDEQA
jgi:hypothetical protein